jgi:hypothetical protein
VTILGEDGNPIDSSAVSEHEEPTPSVPQADGDATETKPEAIPEGVQDEPKDLQAKDERTFLLIVLDPKTLRVADLVGNNIGNDLRDLLAVTHEATDFLQAKLALSHFKAMMTSGVRPATGREVSAIQQAEQKRFLGRKR